MRLPDAERYADWTDADLVCAYTSSADRRALATLFQRYSHLLYFLCHKYLRDAEDSKDAVMDIYVRVAERLPTAHVREFRTWIHSVARNHCLMELRSRRPEQTSLESVEPTRLQTAPIDNSDGDAAPGLLAMLEQALTGLKIAHRRCLRLFYFEKKSYRQIAAETGFDVKQVKSHIQNGRRNLRKLLTHEMRLRNE